MKATAKQDEERRKLWDGFLDAYALYLQDPSLTNAAFLHRAGVALEQAEDSFTAREFERRLGWNVGNETAA